MIVALCQSIEMRDSSAASGSLRNYNAELLFFARVPQTTVDGAYFDALNCALAITILH